MPDEIEVLDRTLSRLRSEQAAAAPQQAAADAAALARIDAARAALRKAEARAYKESRDVDRLGSFGVTRVVASLQGKLEAEIAREEAESAAAWEAKNGAARELEAALAELRTLREGAARQGKVIDQIRWRKVELLEGRDPSAFELRWVGEQRAACRARVDAWRLALRSWGALRRKIASGAVNAMAGHAFYESFTYHAWDDEQELAFEQYSESLASEVPGIAAVERAFDAAGLPRVDIPIDEIDTARNSLPALLGNALVDMVVYGAAVQRMQRKLDAAIALAQRQLADEEQKLADLEERWARV